MDDGSTINRVSGMLKEEKGVTCKLDWLSACIEWAIEIEQMVTHNQLLAVVYCLVLSVHSITVHQPFLMPTLLVDFCVILNECACMF